LKVLEHQYGKSKCEIPKNFLDRYLMGRTVESKKEKTANITRTSNTFMRRDLLF
jgi:hypothetical protein